MSAGLSKAAPLVDIFRRRHLVVPTSHPDRGVATLKVDLALVVITPTTLRM